VSAFVGLAFVISWAAWLPLLAQTHGWGASSPRPILHLVGGLGPSIAAVIVIGCLDGRRGLVELGHRLTSWRGRRQAWAFVLVVPPALLLLTAPLAAVVAGGSPDDMNWAAFGRSTEFAGLPVLTYWLANLIFFGLGEEVGWRGFLQPRLELRRTAVASAGLVSIPWALWHLPLFGVTPSYRAMPLLGFLGFALSIWVASWIFAWLLHVGGGSLLIVVVFHAWFDIVTNSPLGPPLLPTAMGAAVTVVGLVVLHRLLKLPRSSATPDGVSAGVRRSSS
jgi:membrane protease YdiL (CAAX protease family)